MSLTGVNTFPRGCAGRACVRGVVAVAGRGRGQIKVTHIMKQKRQQTGMQVRRVSDWAPMLTESVQAMSPAEVGVKLGQQQTL